MTIGRAPNSDIADSVATARAGNDPEANTATVSPSATPDSSSRLTSRDAQAGLVETFLASSDPSVVVMAV